MQHLHLDDPLPAPHEPDNGGPEQDHEGRVDEGGEFRGGDGRGDETLVKIAVEAEHPAVEFFGEEAKQPDQHAGGPEGGDRVDAKPDEGGGAAAVAVDVADPVAGRQQRESEAAGVEGVGAGPELFVERMEVAPAPPDERQGEGGGEEPGEPAGDVSLAAFEVVAGEEADESGGDGGEGGEGAFGVEGAFAVEVGGGEQGTVDDRGEVGGGVEVGRQEAGVFRDGHGGGQPSRERGGRRRARGGTEVSVNGNGEDGEGEEVAHDDGCGGEKPGAGGGPEEQQGAGGVDDGDALEDAHDAKVAEVGGGVGEEQAEVGAGGGEDGQQQAEDEQEDGAGGDSAVEGGAGGGVELLRVQRVGDGDADDEQEERHDQVGGGAAVPGGVLEGVVDGGPGAGVVDQDHGGDGGAAEDVEREQAGGLGGRRGAGCVGHGSSVGCGVGPGKALQGGGRDGLKS